MYKRVVWVRRTSIWSEGRGFESRSCAYRYFYSKNCKENFVRNPVSILILRCACNLSCIQYCKVWAYMANEIFGHASDSDIFKGQRVYSLFSFTFFLINICNYIFILEIECFNIINLKLLLATSLCRSTNFTRHIT